MALLLISDAVSYLCHGWSISRLGLGQFDFLVLGQCGLTWDEMDIATTIWLRLWDKETGLLSGLVLNTYTILPTFKYEIYHVSGFVNSCIVDFVKLVNGWLIQYDCINTIEL